MIPTEQELFDAVDQTWAASMILDETPWRLRAGAGGGKRVSSASLIGTHASEGDIQSAEDWMLAQGQAKLFMLRGSDAELDKQLEHRGYDVVDPVLVLGKSLDGPASEIPNLSINETPTGAQTKIWAAGGIGPARLAIMERAQGPKACFDLDGKATAFVAIRNGICMAHAVEVSVDHRRLGLGRKIMHGISDWAIQNDAHCLVVLTVVENKPAQELYKGLGFQEWARYHYRLKR